VLSSSLAKRAILLFRSVFMEDGRRGEEDPRHPQWWLFNACLSCDACRFPLPISSINPERPLQAVSTAPVERSRDSEREESGNIFLFSSSILFFYLCAFFFLLPSSLDFVFFVSVREKCSSIVSRSNPPTLSTPIMRFIPFTITKLQSSFTRTEMEPINGLLSPNPFNMNSKLTFVSPN